MSFTRIFLADAKAAKEAVILCLALSPFIILVHLPRLRVTSIVQ